MRPTLRQLAAAAVIIVGGLFTTAAIKPQLGLGGVTASGHQLGYRVGGSSQVDTVRVRSRTITFPNSAAITAGYSESDSSYYTHDNKANDGSTVMYGWVNEAQADSVQYSPSANSDFKGWTRPNWSVTARDKNWAAVSDQRFTFLWFSANGLRHGQKVESAYIMFNVPSGGNTTIPAGSALAARLDTLRADYAIINGNSAGRFSNNDYGRFDCTWNKLDKGADVSWSPTLEARDDACDYGPRSDNIIGPGTYAAGTCHRLSVKDAVQQALDNPNFDLSKGFLFLIYATQSGSTTSLDINYGNHPTFVPLGKGNPVFTAEATSRRGARPWGGAALVPIVFLWDDAYDAQVGYYTALRDSGLTFTAATSGYGMAAHDWPDTLLELGQNDFRIVAHSKFHETLGSVSADSLTQDMARKWMLAYFPKAIAVSNFDTTAIVDYAWPGNDRRPNRALNAISAMIDNGYRSARSGGYWWTTGETATHHDTRLSWSGYVNRFLIWSYNARDLFAVSGSPASDAQVADQLRDMIDESYTDYAQAALVIYGHSYNELSSAEFTSEAKMRYVIGLARQWNSCEIMDYGTVVGMRLSGASYLTPAQVEVMRGVGSDSNMIQTMAAQQDSAYAVDSDPNYLQMWLAPK